MLPEIKAKKAREKLSCPECGKTLGHTVRRSGVIKKVCVDCEIRLEIEISSAVVTLKGGVEALLTVYETKEVGRYERPAVMTVDQLADYYAGKL